LLETINIERLHHCQNDFLPFVVISVCDCYW